MLGFGFIQPAQRRRMMLWVLAGCSDGSMQCVACTSVPLHCAGAWVSLMTPFASPRQGSWGQIQPPTVQERLAGTHRSYLCFAGGETEAALACPQKCIAQHRSQVDFVKCIHETA